MNEPLAPFARLLLYSGALLAVGAPVALLVRQVPPLQRPGVVLGRERAGWLLAAIAVAILLVAQFRALEMPMSGDTLKIVLLQTTWGQGWVALLVVCALGALASVARLTVIARMTFALCLAVAMGGLGHAAGDPVVWLARPLDALHVASVAAWIGGLLCIGATACGDLSLAHWQRFSALAQWAAPVAVVTGAGSSWRRIGGAPLGDILTSPYGLWLVGKVVLVVVVLLLGASHRNRLRNASVPTATLVRVELLLALLVLVATAVLTGTAPPGES